MGLQPSRRSSCPSVSTGPTGNRSRDQGDLHDGSCNFASSERHLLSAMEAQYDVAHIVRTMECQADRGVTTRNPSTPFTGDRAGSQGPSLNEALGRAVFGIDEDDVLGIAPRPAPAPRRNGGAFAAEWPRVLARALRPLKEPGVTGSLYQSVGFASVAVSNTARSAHRRCRIGECNWSRAVARTMT